MIREEARPATIRYERIGYLLGAAAINFSGLESRFDRAGDSSDLKGYGVRTTVVEEG